MRKEERKNQTEGGGERRGDQKGERERRGVCNPRREQGGAGREESGAQIDRIL